MHLEKCLSQEDLRTIANAVKRTNTGYEARCLPGKWVSIYPTELEDSHTVISLTEGNWHTPVRVIHKEDEKKVDGICHEEIIKYLMDNTLVFEGLLFDKNSPPEREMKKAK